MTSSRCGNWRARTRWPRARRSSTVRRKPYESAAAKTGILHCLRKYLQERIRAGAVIDYRLPAQGTGEVHLEIHDAQGNLVRKYSSADVAPAADENSEFPKYWLPQFLPLSAAPGVHRFVWDLRYAPPMVKRQEYSMAAIIGKGTVAEPQGPLALPGNYEVWLVAGGVTLKQPLTVDNGPARGCFVRGSKKTARAVA